MFFALLASRCHDSCCRLTQPVLEQHPLLLYLVLGALALFRLLQSQYSPCYVLKTWMTCNRRPNLWDKYYYDDYLFFWDRDNCLRNWNIQLLYLFIRGFKFTVVIIEACRYYHFFVQQNKWIPEELKLTPIAEYLQQYRINWLLHINRMELSGLPRQLLLYVPEGRRSRGRPLKGWRETVTGH